MVERCQHLLRLYYFLFGDGSPLVVKVTSCSRQYQTWLMLTPRRGGENQDGHLAPGGRAQPFLFILDLLRWGWWAKTNPWGKVELVTITSTLFVLRRKVRQIKGCWERRPRHDDTPGASTWRQGSGVLGDSLKTINS